MARPTILLTLLSTAALAAAQSNSIPWRTNPQAAVQEAQRHNRPLMIWVRDSSEDRNQDLERDQKRAFRDARVLRHALNFVPLRLSQSLHRDLLPQFGLRSTADLEMSFVTPDGEQLGTLSGSAIAQPESLAQKLSMVFREYGKLLYDKRVKPQLANAEAEAKDLKEALQLITDFRITTADQDVIELLDRPRLDLPIRKLAYETLAGLSTKAAVDKLVALAGEGDAGAAKALASCTPIGAEIMLAELKADASPFPYDLYKAITSICRITKPKPSRFFTNARLRLKEEELQRVTRIVQDVARQWKIENE